MDGKTALDYYTKFNRITLEVIGVWPNPANKNERLQNFKFITTGLFIFIVLTVTQTTKIIQVWGDLNQTSKLICTAELPILISLIKLVTLWYNKEEMKNLNSFIAKDWENEKPDQEKEIMIKSGQVGKRVLIFCICLGHGTISARIVQVFFENLDIYRNHDINATRTLLIEAYFPFDCNYSPVFEITCFIEYVGVFLGTLSYYGADGLFTQIVVHLCGQYNILRRNLLDIVSEIDIQVSHIDFEEKLNRIVNVHGHINRCIQIMERTFNLMFLSQLLACSAQFCIQGYQLILFWTEENAKSPIVGTIFIITFLIYTMINLFIPCYAADSLQVESFKLAQAAYDCNWFYLPPKKMKNLILIIQRGRKPVEITAGKFCVLNLELFGKILKTSLGYLSVLITMKKSQ